MARETFIQTRLQERVLEIIAKANKVIADYQQQGLTLTVRQLYYRFIAYDLFPDSWIDVTYNARNGLDKNTKNTVKNYKRLAEILNSARMNGLIDWNSIEDRTRWLRDYAKYNDPAHRLRSVPDGYGEDVWADQPHYCEVWVEKDALAGVIEKPCNALRVPFFPTRGYTSQSEQYAAGKRIQEKAAEGKEITIFHLGDHDPSGLDMTRDNEERILMFARLGRINFVRLALNMDQIRQYDPPPNPAKESDSRFANYSAEYGDDSWELDALEPQVIVDLVHDSIEQIIDHDLFRKALAKEQENREKLVALSQNWPEVQTLLGLIERGIGTA